MAEVAGLVLGALPILMKAVEHYRSGLDPFISYFRYNTTLKALHRDLRIQHLYYQDTLKMLLLTELSEDQSDRLFPDAKEPLEPALWGTPEIESILAAKLKTRYEPFKETLEEMDATMKKLMDKLEIDLEGKVRQRRNIEVQR